jgi:GxxExxY protein
MVPKSNPEKRRARLESWVDEVTEKVIGAAIEVHRRLGPGLMESVYEECLCYELQQARLGFQRQVQLPIVYKGIKLDAGYRMDVVVADAVVLELKAVETLLPVHSAQLLTYLKLSGKSVGLLMNFNEPILRKGLRRLVNHFEPSPEAGFDSQQETRRLGASAVR